MPNQTKERAEMTKYIVKAVCGAESFSTVVDSDNSLRAAAWGKKEAYAFFLRRAGVDANSAESLNDLTSRAVKRLGSFKVRLVSVEEVVSRLAHFEVA